MKKKIFVFLILLLCPIFVYADHIYNVRLDIYLNQDGSADITETWEAKADSGTEWYKALYNLGNQELSNFTVTMDGKPMTYKNWNVNESLSQKSGYYGINYVSEGLELCFGKGDMSRHQFTMKYTLSNFITNTSDSQILYQTILPSMSFDNMTGTITSFYEFPDTLDVWGYGGQYLAYVKAGKIELNTDGYSFSNDYLALLVRFPLNTFNTDNYNGDFGSFDDVYKMAEEGTYQYDWGETTKQSKFEKIMGAIIMSVLVSVIAIVGFIYFYIQEKKEMKANKK